MKKRQKVLVTGGEGYIGSAVVLYLSQKGHRVDSIDLEWFAHFDDIHNKKIDYQSLQKDELQSYDTIIHLAGHSSSFLCYKDPFKAFDNNVIGFYKLLKSITGGQKLIYASSSTVYKSLGKHVHTEESEEFNLSSLYEFYFYTIDRLALLSSKQVYGLRLGSVNGPSPNMRTDLILNELVQGAQQKDKVVIGTPYVHRPILGMRDLCRSVEAILLGTPLKGIYNLASFNISTLKLGQKIANFFDVLLETYESSPKFDLCISTDKFKKNLNFEFEDTLESLIHQLISDKNQHYFDQRSA